MPTAKSPKDATEPTTQPDEAAPPSTDNPTETVEPATGETGPEPGVYEFTHFADCVYPHVPLSCRTATGDTPATVFDWPFGPPDDGRWTKTRKKPNQAADNAPAPSSEE